MQTMQQQMTARQQPQPPVQSSSVGEQMLQMQQSMYAMMQVDILAILPLKNSFCSSCPFCASSSFCFFCFLLHHLLQAQYASNMQQQPQASGDTSAQVLQQNFPDA